jgi:NADH-quinone oxidoreductase subunit G
MCDEGRFDTAYVNDQARLREPLQSGARGNWDSVLANLRTDLTRTAASTPAGLAAVLSPYLTVEEGYLLAKLIKSLAANAKLYLGSVPVVGEDDTYPKDRRGRPTGTVKFTIRAEKCPNRRGIEAILKHFQGEVLTLDNAVAAAGKGEIQALYLTSAVPPSRGPWLSAEQTATFAKVPLLIVQDLFASPITSGAKYVLPAASFAEKDGCFVNHAGLAQAIHVAVRPGVHPKSDGQIFLDLLQRRGLLHAETLRKEIAAEVPYFAAFGDGKLGEHGKLLA